MANSNRVGGIGFWGALTLLFIACKLTGYIDWPWVWVLAPIWAPFALAFSIIGLLFLLSILFDWDHR